MGVCLGIPMVPQAPLAPHPGNARPRLHAGDVCRAVDGRVSGTPTSSGKRLIVAYQYQHRGSGKTAFFEVMHFVGREQMGDTLFGVSSTSRLWFFWRELRVPCSARRKFLPDLY